jgi:hypothetical protein
MSSKYPSRNTSNVYTGPSVPEMLANHTLAQEIIARHNDPCPILDDDELSLLQQFIAKPSEARSILANRAVADDSGDSSSDNTKNSGSLVAYVMSKHETDNVGLTDDEIVMLREWFESGGAATD